MNIFTRFYGIRGFIQYFYFLSAKSWVLFSLYVTQVGVFVVGIPFFAKDKSVERLRQEAQKPRALRYLDPFS